jgi:hypothetical protein
MKQLKQIFACSAVVVLTGCIVPYEPRYDGETTHVPVVEAMLLEPDGTYVRLSYIRPLSSNEEDTPSEEPLVYADEVSILCSDSTNIPLRLQQDAVTGTYAYRPEGGIRFREGASYAVDILLDGKQYRSDFITPLRTPEIGEVNYLLYDGGRKMDVRVSTHDPNRQVLHYLWRYDEDWEVVTEYFASLRYDPELDRIIEGMTRETADNRYYCWGKETSKKFLLGTAENMLGGEIRNHTVLQLEQSDMDSRFSYLYSIVVRQYAIPEEAYLYFENMRKSVEETNSVFSPIPARMNGNIRCLSHPGEPVNGFFVATTESASRLYIDAGDVPSMKPQVSCFNIPEKYSASMNPQSLMALGLGILRVDYPDAHIWKPIRCVDCTKHYLATKRKPPFWPNDHL